MFKIQDMNIEDIETIKKAANERLLILDDLDTSSEGEIIFHGHLADGDQVNGIIHGSYLHIRFNGDTFTGTFILENGCLRYFLADTSSYVYLPLENKVVPKALASGISKSRRQKATIHNCYISIDKNAPEITADFLTDYIIMLIKKDELTY